jgi:hypothetical protein
MKRAQWFLLTLAGTRMSSSRRKGGSGTLKLVGYRSTRESVWGSRMMTG